MKKIAVSGYHATGSGVVFDLLRELDNVSNGAYGAEFRILYDPGCISDLEHHLVNDVHRWGTALAIRQFDSYCKKHSRMIERVIGGKWNVLVTDYISSLISIRYKGYTGYEIQFMHPLIQYFYKLRRAINHILPRKFRKPHWYNYFPNHTTFYASLTLSDFYEKTQTFIEKLCVELNVDNKEYVMLDQFVNSQNPNNAFKYVKDLKAIIIDRDPRDLYVHNMVHNDHVLPKDPSIFAKHYRLMRKRCAEEDPTKILHVRYEDMIYKYDEMVPKILDFLGIDASHHVAKKTCFKPGVSINGTQLWIYKAPQYANEVKIIENELPDMVYNYPNEDLRKKIISEVDAKSALKEYATKH